MTIQQDLKQPVLPKFIELFKIDATNLGGDVLYCTPNTLAGNAAVSFGGLTHLPMPISGSGWQTGIDGAAPRPTLTVSNVTRLLQPYLAFYGDLVGAKVTRVQTLDKYLDSGSSPDSSQVFNTGVYIIEQKSKQTKEMIEFVLVSVIDAPLFKLPRGQVLRSEFPGAGLYRK